VFGISSVGGEVFSRESYDNDGHEKAIATIDLCAFDGDGLIRLRLDVVRLMCGVTEKFHTVRDNRKPRSSGNGCDSQCTQACCTNDRIFLPGIGNKDPCGRSTEDDASESTMGGDSSTDPSSISCSDSSYHLSDDEDEIDESADLYGDNTDTDTRQVERTPSDDSDDDNGKHGPGTIYDDGSTDGEDEISVKEMYSDFKTGRKHTRKSLRTDQYCVDSAPDNLVCPGDVLEYCTINMDMVVKRNSVNTIVDTNASSYIVLSDGFVLSPKYHAVRKVKMYCSDTGLLIPNPLSEWHTLGKCILQSGSIDPHDESNETTDHSSDTRLRRQQNQRR